MKEIVTVVAALIAATASLLVLILNLDAQRRAELRLAHRKFLETHLPALSAALHEIVATSNVIVKRKPGSTLASWQKRSEKAQQELKNLRPKLRYPLWGLDEGVRVLTRLPGWVMHLRDRPQHAALLLKRADRLRRRLDRSIQRSYRHGRPPVGYEALLVRWDARRCRDAFRKGMAASKVPQPADGVLSAPGGVDDA